jgi:type IV pilus assembly protein PilA
VGARKRNGRRRRNARLGFSLIELSIVVTIVGILATLAVVGYRKMVNAAHTGEATHMLQAIRVAQESFRAETGSYAAISTNLDQNLCPVTTVKSEKIPWDPSCNGGVGTWSLLPVHVDGPVLFRYTTVSGRAGEAAPAAPTGMGQAVSFGATAPTNDWFVAAARADTDNNGVNVTVVSTSWSNELYVDREGE